MFGWRLRVIGVIWVLSMELWGQKKVDGRNLYERVLAIVPMAGSGTYADPRRPELTPATLAGPEQVTGKGIIAFSYQVSDDGKMAVVELGARDKAALEAVTRSARPGVQVFERGKGNAAAVEAEIRKHIKDFDVAKFGARAH